MLSPTDPINHALFYKQRFKSFNFTMYNTISKQGDCFIWPETEGKRGSCEIASCLYLYFKSTPAVVNHILYFSDRYRGQKLNKFVAAMCLIAVQLLPHLETTDLKCMVVGPNEMERDSMHSAISTEHKIIGKVNWSANWMTIARCDRKKGDKPSTVDEITNKQIIDWKSHQKCHMTFRKADVHGQSINWLYFSKKTQFVINCK
ncbi:hypothetical protein PR048_005950 [Dryococelus australis]|uniref:N-acetyltransferase domain-containing protein n=1 Tax=Dryococelus australis TaxID=614101 RepID=A0ABQ9I9N9_9NEOP|nr:hypothetical protein PR048_005950 [Dryococelus australis]